MALIFVDDSPKLPDRTSLENWARAVGRRLNGVLPKDGSEAMTQPLVLATFTTATKPAAADWAGGVIYVSDGGAGNIIQASNGTSWVSLG